MSNMAGFGFKYIEMMMVGFPLYPAYTYKGIDFNSN